MSSLRSIGEHALVERLQARIGASPSHVTIGIGDDAAVIVPERGTHDVVTTDALVEGVHFRREWTSPRAYGHKALAVNLSDLAAMGAAPRASLLSLILPDDFSVEDFDALVDGFAALAAASGAALVGGNLARSPGPLVIDVTAIGAVRARRVLRRSTAQAGDELYVTGRIGAAAAGLKLVESRADRASLDADALDCVTRYEQPDARTKCGWIVGRVGAATACIDLSDGLADAAARLARASGIGVVVDADALPVHPGALAWSRSTGIDATEFALTGGEDYELAFAVRPKQRRKFLAAVGRCRGLRVTQVGRFTRDGGARLLRHGSETPVAGGFTHF